MILDKKSPIPVYYQLKNYIFTKIKNGEYKEGDMIPSERELAEGFNISRMTVRQAFNQMVSEGLLLREKGRGTFVSKRKIEQRNVSSFSDTVKGKGMEPNTKVITFKRENMLSDIAAKLDIAPEEYLYAIKRLRLANDIPVAVEEVFIPERCCPNIGRFRLDASLYRLIFEEYGIKIAYMDNVIEASMPTNEEKTFLTIPSSTPVLRMACISYTLEDKKFSYERDVYRSDQFAYNARIFLNKDI